MVRPSQGIDAALLRSGMALYPQWGCAGLSVRRVARHAGASPAMFHYHFRDKQIYLRCVLQQVYDEMFGRLVDAERAGGPALERLRGAIGRLAGFVRDHRPLIGRLLADAANGEVVVLAFLRDNAPRHLTLLMRLLEQAEREAAIRPIAPLQRSLFLMGAVGAPLLAASAATRLQFGPAEWAQQLEAQVCSDAAIGERIDLALAALATPAAGSADGAAGERR